MKRIFILWYLGGVKNYKKFCFVTGDKITMSIVDYVKVNHTAQKKAIGNMNVFSIFAKKRSCRKLTYDETSKRRKVEDTECVLSSDIPKEVLNIKRILTDFCTKKCMPREIVGCVRKMEITVKTAQSAKGDFLSLSARIISIP